MVIAQGGDVSYIDDVSKFEVAKNIVEVKSEKSGYVKHIDSLAIGVGAMKLGAGRATVDDVIDMSAGIILNKKVGHFVNKGDILATIYTNKPEKEYKEVLKEVHDAFALTDEKIDIPAIVFDYIY